jgi:hypothetical protein
VKAEAWLSCIRGAQAAILRVVSAENVEVVRRWLALASEEPEKVVVAVGLPEFRNGRPVTFALADSL